MKTCTTAIFSLLLLILVGSSAPVSQTQVSPATVSVMLTPGAALISPGERVQFTATVRGTTKGETWAASSGTISGTGLYDAPGTPGSFNIIATSAADPGRSPSATVTATGESSSGGLSSNIGWHEIPSTLLQKVCPPNNFGKSGYNFSDMCAAVIYAWGGGIADQARNRLILWGGGHNDYYGNEVYALDLNTLRMMRLTDPTVPTNAGSNRCLDEIPPGIGGFPNARHTYGGMTYIAHADTMFHFAGILACVPGGGDNDTWTFNLGTHQWKRMHPSRSPATVNGVIVSDYDPNTRNVYLDNTRDFWMYNYDTNTYTPLNLDHKYISYHMSGAIDPVHKLFVMFGGSFDGNGSGINVVDIRPRSSYTIQDWGRQVSGCGALMKSAYPGLTWDPVQQVVVGYPNGGGSTVYLFNPGTTAVNTPNGTVNSKTCLGLTMGNTAGVNYPPPLTVNNWGIFGRFRYLTNLDVIAYVFDAGQNAWYLRLTPPSARAGATQAVRCPKTAKAHASKDSQEAATVAFPPP